MIYFFKLLFLKFQKKFSKICSLTFFLNDLKNPQKNFWQLYMKCQGFINFFVQNQKKVEKRGTFKIENHICGF